ncbi:MAG: peptidase M20, partial [Pseudohongiella sp.]|nr:peptidase M20 [Pseudohongiella sp.]
MPRVHKRFFTQLLVAVGLLIFGAGAISQQSVGPVVVTQAVAEQFELLLNDPRVQTALAAIEANEPETLAEQVRLTEIPAPPFQEQRRAQYYLQQMQRRGLQDAYIDTEGNV